MSGRVIIVTGASSGIGQKAAEYLCERGDNVILACRNAERGQATVDRIKKKNPEALAHFMELDLASVESIRKFVEAFHATGKKLHVLVNNAGMSLGFKSTKRETTTDGFEITFGTNHLGPFLLTNLLLDDLKQTAEETGDARVIMVASSAHDKATMGRRFRVVDMDMEDLHLVKPGAFTGVQAYKDSKASNIMFMRKLAKDLDGTNVSINAMCPGFIPSTGLGRNNPAGIKVLMKLFSVLRPVMKTIKTVEHGANMIYELADEEKFKGVTGKYLVDLEEGESSEETRDEEKIEKLWQMSGGYLKMDGFEPLDVPEPPPEPEPETAKEETVKEEKTEDKKVEEAKTDDAKEDEAKDEKDETTKGEMEPEDKDNDAKEIKDE
ncbi:uncharacterized protein LOC141911741 [Tubulanus polymorphus]|uniref:uncharacterized protein LOC141911741 n=1 Tax=Tubulanus polymorphus TaxID=672921 RepID=UPI003DA2D035